MKTSDHDEFIALLTATMEVYGHRTSPEAIAIWCAALSRYALADIRRALSAHVQNAGSGRFAPKPADIIGVLQEMDGRPGAEESWARLSHAIGDECATIVLTAEERAAFFAADAIPEDKIAARMAFKETYTKAVQEARAAGRPVEWGAILGFDVAERESKLIEAAERGRLSAGYIAGLLPYRDAPHPRIAALLDAAKDQKRLAA